MTPIRFSRRRLETASLGAVLLIAGCGSGGGDAPRTSRVPSSAGDVWAIDAADRAGSAAAVMAYVHGAHVFVLDGNDAFLGMTRVSGERTSDGGRAFKLSDGQLLEVRTEGDSARLNFSGGERIALAKAPSREENER